MDREEKVMVLFWLFGIVVGYHYLGSVGIALGAQLVWLPLFYYGIIRR